MFNNESQLSKNNKNAKSEVRQQHQEIEQDLHNQTIEAD